MFDVLTERLGKYFRHRDSEHEVLQLGDRAVACENMGFHYHWNQNVC
jgi:hypothetical protein